MDKNDKRWPISQEYREATIRRLLRIVLDPSSSPKEVTAAARTLLLAEGQNQTDDHKRVDIRVQYTDDTVSEIAQELGIEAGLVIDAARATGIGFEELANADEQQGGKLRQASAEDGQAES